MTIHVDIPEALAAKVAIIAKATGKTPEDVVLDAVTKQVDPFAKVREMMAPVYERMEALGITEDETVEDFEFEKHALRRERRAGR